MDSRLPSLPHRVFWICLDWHLWPPPHSWASHIYLCTFPSLLLLLTNSFMAFVMSPLKIFSDSQPFPVSLCGSPQALDDLWASTDHSSHSLGHELPKPRAVSDLFYFPSRCRCLVKYSWVDEGRTLSQNSHKEACVFLLNPLLLRIFRDMGAHSLSPHSSTHSPWFSWHLCSAEGFRFFWE